MNENIFLNEIKSLKRISRGNKSVLKNKYVKLRVIYLLREKYKLTLKEIGFMFGISKERVRNWHAKAYRMNKKGMSIVEYKRYCMSPLRKEYYENN